MPLYSSLSQVQADLNSGSTTLTSIVNHYLKNIESRNGELNVFLEVFADEALEKAETIEQKQKEGKAGKLAGMVLAIKDNICYAGHKVSASSKILNEFESLYTATALQRLLDEDAIVIGRTNCDEFAMGASTENSAFGATKNAADTGRVPGGSSGGSAVAVQADMCLASLGSDTGGSIRQPAAFTGTIGLRPTYAHVSRFGLIAYASSFDQIGPFTNSVDDAKLIMGVMHGADDQDATAARVEVDYSQVEEDKPRKIAFMRDCIEHDALDKEIKERFYALEKKLLAQGHTIEWVDFPYTDYVVPNYYMLTTAEASSNLARFAGMLYGHRSSESHDIESTIVKSRSEGFGEEVQRRIMLGTFVLSAGYYDAYYAKAQKVRRLVKEEMDNLLSKYDFIMLPTSPHPAFKLGANEDPIAMYLEDIFCMQASLAGVPAVSIPIQPNAEGLPLGAQIISKAFSEPNLLDFSNSVLRAGENLI
ncbi:MAG: Asp-tRNA(Asn)/Glu-tRNA(Gln) amidotransferase subunit GatA [Bacteroidia bacterium]